MRKIRVLALPLFVVAIVGSALVAVPAGAQSGGKQRTAQPTGAPVKVMAMGPFSDPTGANDPEWPAAAQARAKYVNTHGFLKDASGATHKLVVLVCDGGIDANKSEQCARDAVSQKVAAAVGYNGNSEAVIIPILAQAGIPFIGDYPNDATATTSPVSFPLVSGGVGVFAGLPLQLRSAGAGKQSYVISDLGSATNSFVQLFVSDSAKRAGITLLSQAIIEPTQVDLGPVSQAATQGGAQGVGIFILGDTAKNFVNTFRQGGNKQKVGTIAPFISNQFVASLGSAANGLLITGTTRFQGTSKAGRMYAADMKAFNSKLTLNDAGADYWLSTWVFERVAATLPTVDATSVLNAMGKLHNFDTGGMTPPISTDANFAGKSPVPLPRLFNPTVVYYQVKGGKLVEVTGNFVNPFAP